MNNCFAFSKKLRLQDKNAFSAVFKDAKKLNQQHFLLLYRENAENNPRLGIIAGKKISKKAVVRNRIKRIMRESFRIYQTELLNFKVDLIVIARPTIVRLEKQQLRKDMDNLWKRFVFCLKK